MLEARLQEKEAKLNGIAYHYSGAIDMMEFFLESVDVMSKEVAKL